MDFNSTSLAYCIDTLVCLPFQVDLACIALKKQCDVLDHGLLVQADLRCFTDDRDVDVAQGIPGISDKMHGRSKKLAGGTALVGWIVVRKKLADVTGANGSKDCIRYGVQHDITITVAHGSDRVLQGYTSEDERST